MRRRFEKTYLGDGVFVRVTDGGSVVLTTEDGIRTTNEIYFDVELLQAFERWLTMARREVNFEQSTEALRAEEPS